ncbi:hypothetical protein AABM34_16910 [Lysinibacillus fusiformis]
MRTLVPINVPAWLLIMMPVLLIILISIIVLIAVHLVKTKQKATNHKDEKNNNYEDKTLTSWIKKKDLLYWLLIICLGTISLFTFRYKDATEVISHWGFAGTIVSIILAVIAIGFTLFQTLSSDLSSAKIAESADKIVNASRELDSSELQKSSDIIKDAASGLIQMQSIIESKFNNLTTELSELKKYHQESLSVLSNLHANSKLKNGENTDIILSMEDFIQKLFPKLSDYVQGTAYLYFRGIYKKYSSDTEYDYLIEFGQTSLNTIREEIRLT